MQATLQAKIADEAIHPAFEAIADLYGRAERTLYVDLYVRGQPWESCRSEYLSHFGLTARQFNAMRITLGGKVEAARQGLLLRVGNLRAAVDAAAKTVAKITKELKSLGKRPKRKRGRFVHDAEQAQRRARTASRLRQLENLQAGLTAAEEDRRTGRIHLCFGGKRLFRRQFAWQENGCPDLAGWRRDWRRARSSPFFCVGAKDETAGNETCTRQPGILRLCVPPALAERFGHWITIPSVRVAYGQEVREAAVAAGQAVSYRLVRRERRGTDVWYVHATMERTPAAVETSLGLGALGIDLNPAHVQVAEVDRFGNPVHVRRIAVAIQGRRQPQVKAALGEVAADVVAQAKAAAKPVMVERLDFREKKGRLREHSHRQARLLSLFAYSRWHQRLCSRAAREGVQVVEINPAYTSVIGFAKFGPGYGLSPHAAAVVARRGLRFGQRCRSRCALVLPARNRTRHVWSDWRRVAQGLREGWRSGRYPGVCTDERGRRPSEGGRGRGIPRSSVAPAVAPAPQGPPCDGFAAVPGCDPPPQMVGNTVRPAL